MPRIARVAAGGVVQHVLNRGNGRMRLFHADADYQAFVDLLGAALDRVPGVRLLGWCLMPNHWHLLVWPAGDGDLSAFMRWLTNTHVRRWRSHRHTVGQGHVYQGRYKSFLVQDDRHYLTVLRYVEANAGRAGLADRAEAWPWGSLHTRATAAGRPLVADGPLDRPPGWLAIVNEPMARPALAGVRASVVRGRPFGDADWTRRTAGRLGLGFTLRPRGRPRKGEIS